MTLNKIAVKQQVKTGNNRLGTTRIKITSKLVATTIIKIKADTKNRFPKAVDISLHTHQVSPNNQESIIINVGHKTDKKLKDIIKNLSKY